MNDVDCATPKKNRTRMTRQFLRLAFFVIAGILYFSGSAMAVGGYLTGTIAPNRGFNVFYSSSTTGTTAWSASSNRCNVCHSSGGGTDLNPYGRAWAEQHNMGISTEQAFTNVQNVNSDGNAGGASNLTEINAGTQPGWTTGTTQLYDIFSLTPTTTTSSAPAGLVGLADPTATTTTTTTSTTSTTAATTTSTAPTTTTSTTAPTTTTTSSATTTTTAPTTTTTTSAPTTTTTTKASTTTTAPTTTSTTRPTTTTTAPTTTTTKATTTTTRPTTTTTTKATTTTTRRTTTTTTRRTTTTTGSTTTTTLPSAGAALYDSFCASCHDGAAALGGGRNVVGARTCSIDGAINGTSVFPGGVPAMQWLQGQLTPEEIQAISDALNANPVTGQQRYVAACAGCHGMDARGGRVGESVRGEGSGDIQEAIHEERPMSYLGCLPSSDINAIGNYLKGGRSGGEGRHRGDDRNRRNERD